MVGDEPNTGEARSRRSMMQRSLCDVSALKLVVIQNLILTCVAHPVCKSTLKNASRSVRNRY
jgi:hypothetical protein